MAMEGFKPEKTFDSPEEELKYLREVVKNRDKSEKLEPDFGSEVDIHKTISEYADAKTDEVLGAPLRVDDEEIEKIVLNLTPEEHDSKMNELLGILQEKGIKNAISIVQKMNNPHIEDDFHRFVVQYIKEGFAVDGLKEKSAIWKTLRMTLYQISLPENTKKEGGLKELVSSMEQFYSGMLSLSSSSENDYFTIEIATPEGSEEIMMYSAVPDSKKGLFQKQLHSIFPDAQVIEERNDYNVFIEGGVSLGATAYLKESPIFPIKTYDSYDYDPLNIILNAFSKIEKDTEGAAIQVVFKPVGDYYSSKFKSALGKIKKGVPVGEATNISYGIGGSIKGALRSLVVGSEKPKPEGIKPVDPTIIQNIEEKTKYPIISTNIRIVSSAQTKDRAEEILNDIESTFNQFEKSSVNKIGFHRLKNWKLNSLLRQFSYREFFSPDVMPLNLREITSIAHLPASGIKSSPQFKQSKARDTSAPVSLPREGTVLGVNISRGVETKIYLTKEDRLRHFYTIGQTGTGKTTILKNMITQDILAGEGVCMIDPHGSDIQDILAVIPESRWSDVIYFDPGYTERVMGLNMLEYDPRYPEQKTFVVNELFSIFQKLYGGVPESMGPMFEQYFRNAALLVLEDQESGTTLLDISRVLADEKFREMKLSKSKNPVVNQFWREIASKAGGEGALKNIVPYITSKFDIFLANEIMRPIVAQQKSTFDFRKIMDEKKILLVNLSKGRLGDINSSLIGLILVGKILIAALSRADSPSNGINPFYLYIDEFQNVTTDSISTILSEARKYKLSLNVAHQFIAQLDEKIKDAVFGNVGSMAVFRVGSEDAEFLQKQFDPVFSASDLINIDNFNAYVKILANGSPVKPFNIKTMAPPDGNQQNIEKIKQLSYMKYGRPKEEVENEILQKYQSML